MEETRQALLSYYSPPHLEADKYTTPHPSLVQCPFPNKSSTPPHLDAVKYKTSSLTTSSKSLPHKSSTPPPLEAVKYKTSSLTIANPLPSWKRQLGLPTHYESNVPSQTTPAPLPTWRLLTITLPTHCYGSDIGLVEGWDVLYLTASKSGGVLDLSGKGHWAGSE